MKILFLNPGEFSYISNSYLYGFTELDQAVVCVDNIPEGVIKGGMHEEYGFETRLHGKGFMMTGLIDREKISVHSKAQIEEMIEQKHYDFIIYAHSECHRPFLNLVLKYYIDPKQIILLEGDFSPEIRINPYLMTRCKCFKRELFGPLPGLRPMSLTVPDIKFTEYASARAVIKRWLVAPDDPRLRNTEYQFDDESAYVNSYATSYFGLTMKKNGWDCLRHYEIVISACLPVFLDINQKPTTIMQKWPLKLQQEVNMLYDWAVHTPLCDHASSNPEDIWRNDISIEKFRQHFIPSYIALRDEFYSHVMRYFTSTYGCSYLIDS